jgi:rRNA processing protein Gar1
MKILHTDKRLNNNRLFPKVVLVFGLLVIFILLLSFKGNIVDSFVSISTSIFKGKKAVEENEENIAYLTNENAKLLSIINLATDTREIFNSGVVDVIKARSVLDSTSIVYSDFLLNVGANQGVQVGSIVYVKGMKPVGKVIEVFGRSSKVRLYTYAGNKLEAIVRIKKSDIKYKKLVIATTSIEELADEVEEINATETTSSTAPLIARIENKKNDNFEDFKIELVGDGAFGFTSKIPLNFEIATGTPVYLGEDDSMEVGKIVATTDILNENEKILYINSNYSYSGSSLFFVSK